jgi:hypothetical protein
MLFFHRGLHCLVAIDLKIVEFRPEYAGKMNYYLSLLDRLERREDENRSIGIILCAEKDRVEVELALEDMGKPIGVADYQLIVPQEELKRVVAEEMEAFGKELPLRTERRKTGNNSLRFGTHPPHGNRGRCSGRRRRHRCPRPSHDGPPQRTSGPAHRHKDNVGKLLRMQLGQR